MNEDIKKITIFSGLNKFGEKENFQKIDISEGEVIAIVGPTGSGKSQFLYDLDRLRKAIPKAKEKYLLTTKFPKKNGNLIQKRK